MRFARASKLRRSTAYYVCTTKVDFPATEAPGVRVHGSVPKGAKSHSGSATGHSRIRKNAERERSDTHDPRRGCTRKIQKVRKRTAGAIRRARSPQRVRGDASKYAKTYSGSAPTRTIPAEGARGPFKIRKSAQRELSDTHDPRRGCAGTLHNTHKRTGGALQHARSPQRVRGDTSKYAKTHSGSAPTPRSPQRGASR